MKGIETKMLLGLIMLLVVILIVFVIVFYPAIAFKNNTEDKRNFEDFCVFWSITGYNKQIEEVNVGKTPVKISQMCSFTDIDNCIKCCKKEIVC